jgi:hypothetical protein
MAELLTALLSRSCGCRCAMTTGCRCQPGQAGRSWVGCRGSTLGRGVVPGSAQPAVDPRQLSMGDPAVTGRRRPEGVISGGVAAREVWAVEPVLRRVIAAWVSDGAAVDDLVHDALEHLLKPGDALRRR